MLRRCSLLALALSASACGARSELVDSTDKLESGIFVADTQYFTGAPARLVRFTDMKGTGWQQLELPELSSGICAPALDSEGHIYLADASSMRVLRVDGMSGANVTSFGSYGEGEGQFSGPAGVAIDAQDRIYVVDKPANRIIRVDDMSGSGWVTLSVPSGKTPLASPWGLAISSKGQILIGDSKNHRLVQVDDMSGAGWQEWAMPGQAGQDAYPAGVAYDSQDRIYAVDFNGYVVHRIDGIEGDGHEVSTTPDGLVQASHVAVGPDGRIYVSLLNAGSALVAMDDLTGAGMQIFTGKGDPPFGNPCGVAVR